MTLTEVLVGLVILVGMAGVVVPVLPGSVLIAAAVLVWAIQVGTGTGWAVFAVATTVLAVGAVVKYAVPHRDLRQAGVPTRTLAWGAVAALVGLFVIPYLGLLVGFVAGVYLAERARLGASQAWPSTRQALRAVGVSILIELAAALLAAATWTVGVVAT